MNKYLQKLPKEIENIIYTNVFSLSYKNSLNEMENEMFLCSSCSQKKFFKKFICSSCDDSFCTQCFDNKLYVKYEYFDRYDIYNLNKLNMCKDCIYSKIILERYTRNLGITEKDVSYLNFIDNYMNSTQKYELIHFLENLKEDININIVKEFVFTNILPEICI